jgi:hypothetical protein
MRNNSTTLTGWCDFNRKAKSEYAAVATLARNNNDPAPSLPVALTTLYLDYLELLCRANPKRRGTSGKGQRGGGVEAETIMSHWELWGACTLCNP